VNDIAVVIDLDKPMPSLPAITLDALDMYITHLALTGRKRKSAILARIEPQSLWAYRKKNSELKERELEAMAFYEEKLVEDIETEIERRAIKGVTEPVFYEGAKCGHKRVYSDRLLTLLAKRHIPEYRDHVTADVNMKAGVLVVNQPMTMNDWEKAYGQSVPGGITTDAEAAGQGDNPQSSEAGPAGDNDGGCE
jgi:hypothetical protein